MSKVTVVTFKHCEDDGCDVLAVIGGTSKAKAIKVAVANRAEVDYPCRIVESEFGGYILEERFKDDDYEDGFTPWMESGDITISAHKVI